MNAITPIVAAETDIWRATHASANAWRGHMIHVFTEAEAEMSETLLLLSQTGEQGAKVELQPLLGQKFADLATAIGPDGAFAEAGKRARGPLGEFRKYEQLRAKLCHGCARVAVEQNGEWIVALHMLTFRGKTVERSVTYFEQREAEALLRGVKASKQKLVAALAIMRAALSAESH